ncbi:hypothetical protein JCM10914A_28720 [Paenibacillus sp. JCM 10914]|uniref:HTH domain-containing protein n=1 Tax=Paenibacillus sp. JCM 10914 TaxID=1236974 RepID=UPI0006901487|nr:HTH domain-containing protein [Paenibacillus sp. JCM 10914]
MDSIKKIVIPNNDEDEFGRMFEIVTNKYHISTQSLGLITGIDEELINKQEYGHDLTTLKQLLVMLSTGMEQVGEDERVRGILEVLNQVFNITCQTIALYSKVDENDVEQMLNGNYDQISFENRYRIATTSIFLHYLFNKTSLR